MNRLNMEIIEVVWSSAIETSADKDEEFTNIEILNKIKNIIMSRNEKGVG